jgi:ABC-2 type transport system permease protein
MRKVILIGWKDLRIAARDRAGWLLMLAAPFVLTVAMGFVSGRFAGGNAGGPADIPVVIVNEDPGMLGTALVDTMTSPELADLLEPAVLHDVAAARLRVDDNQVAAAVIVPEGWTASIIPTDTSGATPSPVVIELYVNPARPIGSEVVRAVLDEFVNQVEEGRISGEVAVAQMLQHGLIDADEAPQIGETIGQAASGRARLLTLRNDRQATEEASQGFDLLIFFAPSMALLFLMFTVSLGGRGMLAERQQGTLARLRVSPTSTSQVLGGKLFGIFLTGAAQVLILILASTLLFGLRWGDPLGVLLLVVAVALAATGWGLLLAAFATTPSQVTNVGTAVMLLFGILSGSFVAPGTFPDWLTNVGWITPNFWGLQGFTRLGTGGTTRDILTSIGMLLLMASVLFLVSVPMFRRRGFA